jgi:hypothetical protein
MRIRLLVIVQSPFFVAGCGRYQPRNGDIIFQTSLSDQSVAIQAATKSPYSHLGIVYELAQ